MWNSVVTELHGDGVLSGMTVKRLLKTGEERRVDADEDDGMFGVFVFVGFLPNSELFEGAVDMEYNYIVTDEEMRTNIPGVYAADDILRNLSVRSSPLAPTAPSPPCKVRHDLAAGVIG